MNSPIDLVAGQFQMIQQLVAAMVSFRKPLVAAINGPARNIGAQVGLLCDAAIACPDTTLFDDHVKNGIAAGDGGTMLWPLLVGMARARKILLLGRELSAEEGLELHLVNKIVERDQVVPEAVALARELGESPGWHISPPGWRSETGGACPPPSPGTWRPHTRRPDWSSRHSRPRWAPERRYSPVAAARYLTWPFTNGPTGSRPRPPGWPRRSRGRSS